MAFQEVSSLDADVTVALGKRDKKTGKAYPKEAEGYYLGSRKVQNKRGESNLHFLQTAEGNLGVWGTTDLDRKLSQIIPGSMVRITSTGTRPTPNGDMYTYKVEVDKTNTIEVAVSSTAYSSDDSSEEVDSDTYESGDDVVDTETALIAEAAERKARVQALLNGKGKTVKN